MQSINPFTEEVFASVEPISDDDLNSALDRAVSACNGWKTKSYEARAKFLRRAAELLRERRKELAKIMTLEMGKPIPQADAEIEKCAWTCEYFADNAEKFLEPRVIDTDATKSYVQYDPLGIIFAVMPWNFPYWQVVRFAAPALMAGNVGVLKHASNVQQCALAIEKVFTDAGFPLGVFQNIALESSRAEKLVSDPRIAAVTLTGSEAAGAAVAAAAGRAIKKTVLELGGSDPFIVLDDANVEMAAQVATTARLQSNGQSCIAAKRFIVTKAVSEKFITAFKAQFEKMVIGDPLDDKTNIGPVVNKQGFDALERQVKESVERGATLVTGGKRVGDRGYVYAPTILSNVKKGMPAYDEEVFGPVGAVITVADEKEAIAVANDTVYGLGASLWTANVKRATELAGQINAGMIFINGMVKSDPRLPFGGVKRSGYGREVSMFGINEFVNIKTVWIK